MTAKPIIRTSYHSCSSASLSASLRLSARSNDASARSFSSAVYCGSVRAPHAGNVALRAAPRAAADGLIAARPVVEKGRDPAHQLEPEFIHVDRPLVVLVRSDRRGLCSRARGLRAAALRRSGGLPLWCFAFSSGRHPKILRGNSSPPPGGKIRRRSSLSCCPRRGARAERRAAHLRRALRSRPPATQTSVRSLRHSSALETGASLAKDARLSALHLRRFWAPGPCFRDRTGVASTALIREAYASLRPVLVQPSKAGPHSGAGR